MLPGHLSTVPTPAEARLWSAEQIIELAEANAAARRQLAAAQRQLDWFRRQLFGQKSEKRRPEAPSAQLSLGELPVPDAPPPLPGQAIRAHTRRRRATDFAQGDEPSGPLCFDPRVPVETIPVPNPEIAGLAPDQYEVIGERISHRLAQRPGSSIILKYVRPVIQAQGRRNAPLSAGPGGRPGRQSRRRELPRRAPDRQVRLASAAPPTASASPGGGPPGQPPLAHPTRGSGRGAARTDLRGSAGVDPRLAGQGHGRDADQGRPGRPRQAEEQLLLTGLWRTRRSLFPVLREPRPCECRGGAGPDPGRTRRPALGRLWRLWRLRGPDRTHPRPMLGPLPARVH
ncbi:protein of unknown function (plasmid) [Candidatus Methylocalor cossyra]|uniref:Transposase TnpC homeodomain domain-containing protein n=1 Tax=Candidatus Methylocalor cossyra TaxID=3108543 RepID=A0ABM9NMZ5_9GAMM